MHLFGLLLHLGPLAEFGNQASQFAHQGSHATMGPFVQFCVFLFSDVPSPPFSMLWLVWLVRVLSFFAHGL